MKDRMNETNDVQGYLWGLPYDLRRPTAERYRRRWWNEDDRRVLTPKSFGLGYAINLYEVGRRLKFLE